MNVLGLFVAAAMRCHKGEIRLRGAIAIDADGMRATVSFEEGEVVVTRRELPVKVTLSAPMALFVAAIVRPRLVTLLRVKVKGSRLFALRAMPYFKP